jgi:hypothetical protein
VAFDKTVDLIGPKDQNGHIGRGNHVRSSGPGECERQLSEDITCFKLRDYFPQ